MVVVGIVVVVGMVVDGTVVAGAVLVVAGAVVVVVGVGNVPTRYVDGAPKASVSKPFVDAQAAFQSARPSVVTTCTSNGMPWNGPFVLIVPATSKVIGVSLSIGPNVTGAVKAATLVVAFMSFELEVPATIACSRSEQFGKG